MTSRDHAKRKVCTPNVETHILTVKQNSAFTYNSQQTKAYNNTSWTSSNSYTYKIF